MSDDMLDSTTGVPAALLRGLTVTRVWDDADGQVTDEEARLVEAVLGENEDDDE